MRDSVWKQRRIWVGDDLDGEHFTFYHCAESDDEYDSQDSESEGEDYDLLVKARRATEAKLENGGGQRGQLGGEEESGQVMGQSGGGAVSEISGQPAAYDMTTNQICEQMEMGDTQGSKEDAAAAEASGQWVCPSERCLIAITKPYLHPSGKVFVCRDGRWHEEERRGSRDEEAEEESNDEDNTEAGVKTCNGGVCDRIRPRSQDDDDSNLLSVDVEEEHMEAATDALQDGDVTVLKEVNTDCCGVAEEVTEQCEAGNEDLETDCETGDQGDSSVNDDNEVEDDYEIRNGGSENGYQRFTERTESHWMGYGQASQLVSCKVLEEEDHLTEEDWSQLLTMIEDRDGEGLKNWFEIHEVAPSSKIIRNGSKYRMSPLHATVKVGSLTIFNFLLGEGFLLDQGELVLPVLHMAAKYFRFAIVDAVLDLGMDVNMADRDSMTALHVAARQDVDMSESLKHLLTRGADVNQQETQHGFTALHLAVVFASIPNVGTLLRAGARVDILCNSDVTPFHYAIGRSSLRMVKMIYKRGGRARTQSGAELIRSVERKNAHMLRYLLSKNLPLGTTSAGVITAIMCNIHPVRHQMIDILTKAGVYTKDKWLDQFFSRSVFGDEHFDEIRETLRWNFTHVKTLQELSVFRIRECLGQDLPWSVCTLPLPLYLKNAVRLKHLV